MDDLEFAFEELQLTIGGFPCEGAMFEGTAILSEKDGLFEVSSIELKGGHILLPESNRCYVVTSREKMLFHWIADVITDTTTDIGKRAVEEWWEALANDRDDRRMGYGYGDRVYNAMREAAE
ncbi:hypothetical protein [Rhizobium alvei]|uniref:Uncharacterized protein n=1 Tax=Rhizobium alvei TaxID=1132659 RepID=A0ABT8YTD3_9HYPH|nr:hypothetical protein [Rhizobium alvei]MDO6966944.1 hypothetical protein [Rhizobium alvei]